MIARGVAAAVMAACLAPGVRAEDAGMNELGKMETSIRKEVKSAKKKSADAAPPALSPRELMVRRAFARITAAYYSPEFQLWIEDKAPLPAPPYLAYDDGIDLVLLDCRTMRLYPYADGTSAASTYCGVTPTVMIGTVLHQRSVNEDEIAGTLGHELWHLIDRHGDKIDAFLDPTCRKWAAGWLKTPRGREWLLTARPDGGRLELKEMCLIRSDEARFFLQKQEADCDHWGVKLAELAGYRGGANREKWQRRSDETAPQSIYGTHPPPDVRAWLLKPLDGGWVPPSK